MMVTRRKEGIPVLYAHMQEQCKAQAADGKNFCFQYLKLHSPEWGFGCWEGAQKSSNPGNNSYVVNSWVSVLLTVKLHRFQQCICCYGCLFDSQRHLKVNHKTAKSLPRQSERASVWSKTEHWFKHQSIVNYNTMFWMHLDSEILTFGLPQPLATFPRQFESCCDKEVKPEIIPGMHHVQRKSQSRQDLDTSKKPEVRSVRVFPFGSVKSAAADKTAMPYQDSLLLHTKAHGIWINQNSTSG